MHLLQTFHHHRNHLCRLCRRRRRRRRRHPRPSIPRGHHSRHPDWGSFTKKTRMKMTKKTSKNTDIRRRNRELTLPFGRSGGRCWRPTSRRSGADGNRAGGWTGLGWATTRTSCSRRPSARASTAAAAAVPPRAGGAATRSRRWRGWMRSSRRTACGWRTYRVTTTVSKNELMAVSVSRSTTEASPLIISSWTRKPSDHEEMIPRSPIRFL